MAKISAHHYIYISLYMVVPALVLAGWWALGGWGKRLCVEEGGGCGGERCDWVRREWGREDGDWRDRGRVDEEMGKYHPEISDGSKGG